MNFAIMKMRYAEKTIEEIAKEAIELGYNSKLWNSKTAMATQLRDLIAIRVSNENKICANTQFDKVMEMTNEIMRKAAC